MTTATVGRDFRIVSVDDHLVQPPGLWQDRLPAKYRERGPRVVEGAGGDLDLFLSRFGIDNRPESLGDRPPVAGDAWVYDGAVFPTTRASAVGDGPMDDLSVLLAFRYADLPPEFTDPAARARAMTADGVLASLCFPMSEFPRFCGQSFLEGDDKDLGLACIRAYNDYVTSDLVTGAPGRFIPLALVPLWDPRLAADELERAASLGARAVAFSENPHRLGLPSLHDPDGHWDPLFGAAQDAGTPLCVHIGSGSWVPPAPPEQPFTVGLCNTSTLSTLTFYDWIMSDVFVRHPGLKLVLSEGGVGWLPHAVEKADYVWRRHGKWLSTKLPEPPSHYFAEHVYGCFIDDIFGAAHLRDIGIDNCMMETDYPHSDSSYPNTLAMTMARLAYLDDDELHKVTRGNAERVFNFRAADLGAPVAAD